MNRARNEKSAGHFANISPDFGCSVGKMNGTGSEGAIEHTHGFLSYHLPSVIDNPRAQGWERDHDIDEEGRDVGTAWITHAIRMNSCIYQKKYYYVVYDENISRLVLHAEDIFR